MIAWVAASPRPAPLSLGNRLRAGQTTPAARSLPVPGRRMPPAWPPTGRGAFCAGKSGETVSIPFLHPQALLLTSASPPATHFRTNWRFVPGDVSARLCVRSPPASVETWERGYALCGRMAHRERSWGRLRRCGSPAILHAASAVQYSSCGFVRTPISLFRAPAESNDAIALAGAIRP